MNKKGEEKLFSFWWFVCLVIVSVFVIAYLLIFLNKGVDVSRSEVLLLEQKIKDCIIKNGFIIDISNWTEDEFFVFCNLNQKNFDEELGLFFNLTIIDEEGKKVKTIRKGKVSFEEDCLIGVSGKGYPSCLLVKENFLYYNPSTKRLEYWSFNLIAASKNKGTKFINKKLQ
ncbi:MAG: hypothetical protein QW273_02600 [Candidatus Pacearchaeota archaeon]